ncbi:MAG: tetratricopeptide repeat protein [Candidatus Hydrogenedentes bacterium]|nr:tetratricopeptide repeat protein [Candidatus Hydrogenedentota bacterium]
MTVEKANKVNKTARGSRPLFEEEDKKGDLQQLIEHVQANPLLYAVGALVIVLVVLAGVIYRSNTASRQRDFMTKYAKALESEDANLRVAALEPLAIGKDDLAAQALYMLGESAYQAQQYDKSKTAYERLRSEFPNSVNTPSAVEGLGFIAENKADHETALGIYKEILEKWPATFVGRRQNGG